MSGGSEFESAGEGDIGAPSTVSSVIAGSLVAAATAALGPAGAVAGAFLTPVASEMFQRAQAEWRSQAERKSSLLLTTAADASAQTIEELLENVTSDPTKVSLLAQTVEAATRTSLDAKVRVLGGSLASGALGEDTAHVDQAALRVTAIAEIEAPHLKVLALIAEGTTREWAAEWKGVPESDIAEAVPGARGARTSGVVQPILRVLERNGLIYAAGQGEIWDEHMADDLRPNAGSTTWAVTVFGRAVLQDFEDAGLAAER